MSLTFYKITRILRVLEQIFKYVLVAGWAVCLFMGGTIAIAAAVLGILACAVTSII